MRPSILLSFVFMLSLSARAELNIATPAELIERASQGKSQLRDVINELDQQLTEMRDVRTFDQYFFLLDRLQTLSVQSNLDSVYPEAVKRLGARMVQKGVNWLDVIKSPRANILYYHRWMEPSAAFNFLYAAELQVKDEKSLAALSIAAGNLEAALQFADQKWPQERTLRLLYRETLSVVANRVLTKHTLSSEDVSFWIRKIYSPESMNELLTTLQNDLYLITLMSKADLHGTLEKLIAIHQQINKPNFGAPEGLHTQLGDAAVDLILKSLVYEQELTDEEFSGALEILKLRHLSALAYSWAGMWQLPSKDFSEYSIHRAFQFVDFLEEQQLRGEANTLSSVLSTKAAAIFGRRDQIEGTWSMTGADGKAWKLVVAYANRETLIAAFSDDKGLSRRSLARVTYDMSQNAYIGVSTASTLNSDRNLPVRFSLQDDGSLKVEDLVKAPGKSVIAKKTQSFKDSLSSEDKQSTEESEVFESHEFNGQFEGKLPLPSGRPRQVSLVVTLANGVSVGNLTFMDRANDHIAFNFGTEGTRGVLYLTRGQREDAAQAGGMWIQLRLRLNESGNLIATAIYGHHGMADKEFELKRVRE